VQLFAHVKFESALVGLVCIAVGCINDRASAITAEVARKCAALTAKAFPPQVPGNRTHREPRVSLAATLLMPRPPALVPGQREKLPGGPAPADRNFHKARNVAERRPKPLHASVRRALRQAWELDDADKAERLLRNLARRLDQEAPGVAASILEGLDEMLTVVRLKLPTPLRRSLACTNAIENMMGTVRRVSRNVSAGAMPRWRCAGPPPACWKRPRASVG
jgi:Transposase, Mutator family